MWKPVLTYGVVLALGTVALQFLDYQRWVRSNTEELYFFLIAAAFLGLGIWVGARLFGVRLPPSEPGNPKAVEQLGISPSELTVLTKLAVGHSNKEIAAALDISPNTVKTHVAHLFEKLGANRRTDAINRARELGILP
jgi:DNA-binding CsgD family transcriptional regulator